MITWYGWWFLSYITWSDGHLKFRRFFNLTSNCFPPSVKIMLIAVKLGSPTPSIPFPFTVQVLPTLKVIVRRKSWWCFWRTTFRPKKHHRGWSCDIEADYCPDIAKDIVAEYRKPARMRELSRSVGLYTALASHAMMHEINDPKGLLYWNI